LNSINILEYNNLGILGGIVTDNGAVTRLDSYHGWEPAIEVPFISILFLELIISKSTFTVILVPKLEC